MSGTEEQQQQKKTDFAEVPIDDKLKIYYCRCLEDFLTPPENLL